MAKKKMINKKYLIKKYIQEKLSLRTIGIINNVDSTTILYYMKKYKIPRRTRTEIQIGKYRKKARGWKGGYRKNSNGYILIYSPNHPYSDKSGYIREHRLVMEKHIGRYLKPKEIVHHINGNKGDNRINNLTLFPNKNAHTSFHKMQQNFYLDMNSWFYKNCKKQRKCKAKICNECPFRELIENKERRRR